MAQTRRQFLSLAAKASTLAVGLNAAGAPLASLLAATPDHSGHHPDPPEPSAAPSSKTGQASLYGLLRPEGRLDLTAGLVPGLLPATGAAMLAYTARQNGSTWRNPVLVLRKGQEFRARLINGLDEPSIIHWHGLDGDWRQAGHPSYAVGPGGSYDYAFPVTNRAGTYWYHPHPHGLTAKQSYLGLASFFLVRDDEEEALARELDLRLGVNDLPIVLQDKRFDAQGGLVYAPDANDLAMGYLGSEVLANGARRPVLDADTRLYRLRLLNGCTARIFNLRVLLGRRAQPFTLLANDGGLLDAPRRLDAVFLAPGERVELLLDLRGLKPGETLTVANAPFDPMHQEGEGHDAHGGGAAQTAQESGHGTGHGTRHGAGHGSSSAPPLAEDAAYAILSLKVARVEAYDRSIPARLSALAERGPTAQSAVDRGPVRRLDLALDRHNKRWTIAGLTYDMAASPLVVERRGVEAWEFVGAKDGMPHPMHLHGYFFRVTGRQGSPEQVRSRALDATGRLATDLGLKDTVLVWPGETVAVQVDFASPAYPGAQNFLLHCHNLEHEDQGMMLNVLVR